MKHLLLLHGALGSAKQLDPLKEILSEYYIVSSLNFSGHGGEALPSAFTIDHFVDDVISFLKNNGITNTHIFGYSMGGYVAIKTILKSPGIFDKIITLGTKFDWSTESAKKQTASLVPDKIEEKFPAFAAALQKLHSGQDWKLIVEKTAVMLNAMTVENELSLKDFSTISNEVLITVGDQDKLVSIEESKLVAQALPNGSFLCIEGFPHPVEQIDATRMSNVIAGFLG